MAMKLTPLVRLGESPTVIERLPVGRRLRDYLLAAGDSPESVSAALEDLVINREDPPLASSLIKRLEAATDRLDQGLAATSDLEAVNERLDHLQEMIELIAQNLPSEPKKTSFFR